MDTDPHFSHHSKAGNERYWKNQLSRLTKLSKVDIYMFQWKLDTFWRVFLVKKKLQKVTSTKEILEIFKTFIPYCEANCSTISFWVLFCFQLFLILNFFVKNFWEKKHVIWSTLNPVLDPLDSIFSMLEFFSPQLRLD